MTLSSANRTVVYTGNGTTTVFPYSFWIQKIGDYKVYLRLISTGGDTLLVEGVDYSITGIDPNPAAGGNVTYPLSGSPMPSTHKIVITRIVAYTQDLDIRNQDGFLPDTLENELDRMVMQIQQLADDLSRTMRVPIGTAISTVVDHYYATDGNGFFRDVGVLNQAASETSAAESAASALEAAASAIAAAASADEAAASVLTVQDIPYVDDIETTTILPARAAIRPVGFSVVDPLDSTWKRIAAPGTPKNWHKQSVDGQWWEIADHVIHPFMFGAVGNDTGSGTSSTDDTDAFLSAFEMLNGYAQSGAGVGLPRPGTLLIPAGHYRIAGALDGFANGFRRNHLISGYGAVLRFTGGGAYAMNLGASANGAGVTVEGLTFDLSTVNTYTDGLRLTGASSTNLRKLYFSGGGNVGSPRMIEIRQTDINDNNTGSFWVTIDDCWIRKNGANNIAYGILSVGANNALTITNNKITVGVGTGILLQGNSGTTNTAANSVAIMRNHFEGVTYGVHYATPPSQRPYGLVCDFNRFEAFTTAYRFTLDSGSYAVDQQMPVIGPHDMAIGSITTFVANVDSAPLQFLNQRNRSGEAVILNGNSSVAVAFPTGEYSANYQVVVGGTNDQSLCWDAAATTGFTIKRAGTTGALTVRWTLLPGDY